MFFFNKKVGVATDNSVFDKETEVISKVVSDTEWDREIASASKIIAEAEIIREPTPHFVVDDVFSPGFIEKIHAMWPNQSLFADAYPGRSNLSLLQATLVKMPAEKRLFFEKLGHEIYPAIVDKSLRHFNGILNPIFGDLLQNLEWGAVPLLTQCEAGFDGQPEHTHFYHNPNWLMTSLLYLGPYEELEGTTFWQPIKGKPDIEWYANIAMDGLRWEHRRDIEPVKTVECKPGRLFCFLEGPLALHGVKPGKIKKNSCRRILRSHIGVSVERFYKERLSFLEPDPMNYMRMFLLPYKIRPDVMEKISVKDIQNREGPGREFVINEIQLRQNEDKPGKIGLVPKF